MLIVQRVHLWQAVDKRIQVHVLIRLNVVVKWCSQQILELVARQRGQRGVVARKGCVCAGRTGRDRL